jgi:hypothetical protein
MGRRRERKAEEATGGGLGRCVTESWYGSASQEAARGALTGRFLFVTAFVYILLPLFWDT